MLPLRVCTAALVCATVLQASRPPVAKLQRGFASLSNGTWDSAFREWNEEGALNAARLDEMRVRLTKLGLEPRAIGDFTAFHPPLLQNLWQRHWVLATFDSGAAFFVFDFQQHKGEWRLSRMDVSPNPQDFVPNLDEKSLPVRVVER